MRCFTNSEMLGKAAMLVWLVIPLLVMGCQISAVPEPKNLPTPLPLSQPTASVGDIVAIPTAFNTPTMPLPSEPSPTCMWDTPKSSSTPTPIPTPGPTPFYVAPPEDPQAYEACETMKNALSRKNPLKYPLDLAVSRDGKTVYSINSRCHDIEHYNFPDCKKFNDISATMLTRTFILTITENQKNVLTFKNGVSPFSCILGNEIETDSQDNIYIKTIYLDVYKITMKNQSVEKIIQPTQEKATVPPDGYPVAGCESWDVKLQGPYELYVDTYNDSLYYMMWGSSEQESDMRIRKWPASQATQSIFQGQISSSIMLSPFSVFKGHLFLFETEHPPPYPINQTHFKFKYPWTFDTRGLNNLKQIQSAADAARFRKYQKINSKGEIYINDAMNHVVWQILPGKGLRRIFAGNGKSGLKDGQGTTAQFHTPSGLSFDAKDNLYVADTGNHAIRKITPDGTVTTFYAEKQP